MKVIRLEADEDILAVKGHLERALAERAILVVPRGCKAFDSSIGLDLLKRWADDLAMEVALVTRNRAVRALARGRGLAAFPSAERAQRAKWIAKGAPGRLEDLASVALLLGFFLLLLAAGLFLMVPSAEVTLVPESRAIEASLEIRASPEVERIEYAAVRIPARAVEMWVEGSGRIPTVSQKDVPHERARGAVTFVNKTGSAVVVPKGTVVSTSAGTRIRFATLENAVVPAWGRAGAEVEALDPGPVGNVGAFMINAIENRPLALRLEVINGEPTSGGSVKLAKVVTRADKERLKASLLKRLHQEAQARMEGELEGGEFIPPESVELAVIDGIYDKLVDEVTDSLSLNMRAIARGVAIDCGDVEALACKALEAKGDFQLVPESLSVRMGEVKKADEGIAFAVEASGMTSAEVDKGRVAELIRGRSVEEARLRLQDLPLQEPPIVEVKPPWLGRVPWFPFRIRISVGVKEAQSCASWL